MKISELIAELERVRAEHGDRPVVIRTDDYGQLDTVTDVKLTLGGNVRIDSY